MEAFLEAFFGCFCLLTAAVFLAYVVHGWGSSE